MAEPFLSEIRIFSFNFPPKGWAFCNGQLLPINQNQALFALLGTTYGGNGQTNFALPNFRGRMPMHRGNGHILGEAGGVESVTLNASQMPAHSHGIPCSSAAGTSRSPAGAVFAREKSGQALPYSNRGANATLNATLAPSTAGGSQPHNNMPPFGVLNFCIALQGIFPSQN